jgi:hypothetical protein
MIRTRRVSIRIQHTEISASVRQVFDPGADRPSSPVDIASPVHCPDCGSTGFRLLDAVDTLDLTASLLKAAADDGRLHFFCSPDNQVWICDRSLQQMKENS